MICPECNRVMAFLTNAPKKGDLVDPRRARIPPDFHRPDRGEPIECPYCGFKVVEGNHLPMDYLDVFEP